MEASLDVDMVSAVCPDCRIVLVEANSSSLADLGTAVDTELTFERHCHHPGHAIVAASGDYGYNPAYPDVSSSVIAVGGTTLQRSANPRGWSESAWSGTGGGCSAYAAKPKWQTDAHCPTRLMNDVSAVADPRAGLAVYDTFAEPGWVVVGGTSAATPIIGAAIALAGDASAIKDASGLYSRPRRRSLTSSAARTRRPRSTARATTSARPCRGMTAQPGSAARTVWPGSYRDQDGGTPD